MVRTPAGEIARSAAHVAVDTLLRVAAADAAVADARTGRNVATAHETVAAELGMSAKTVQRARTLLERLGLAVTVWAGRYLTVLERAAARAKHGATQLRAASTRALISPKEAVALLPVENVQLPRRGYPTPTTHLPRRSPTRVTAQRKTASRPPIPVGVQKLAAQLARRMPWLVKGRHIGVLARLLQRHGLDVEAGWSADRVLTVLEQHLRATGRRVPDPAQQRNPLGYLNTLLTTAAPALEDHATRQRQPKLKPPVSTAPHAPFERPRIITDADLVARAAVIAQIRADIAADRAAVGARTFEVRRPRWAKK